MIVAVIVSVALLAQSHNQNIRYQKAVNQELKTLQTEKQKSDSNLQQKLQEQQQQIDKLKSDVQARAAARQQTIAAKVASYVAAPAEAAAVPSNGAKAFIYARESGNNPAAINASSGACGLGQAYPCSKMPCSLSDYACQDAFFTQYAISRYGSWDGACAFWQAHGWW